MSAADLGFHLPNKKAELKFEIEPVVRVYLEIGSQPAVQALDPVEDYADDSLIFVDSQYALKTI